MKPYWNRKHVRTATILFLAGSLICLSGCSGKVDSSSGRLEENNSGTLSDTQTASAGNPGDAPVPAGPSGDDQLAALPPAPGFHLDFSEPVTMEDASAESSDTTNDAEPTSVFHTDATYRLIQEAGSLRVEGNRAAQPKAIFSLFFPAMDLSSRPTVSLAVRTDRDTNLNLALEDADGKRAFVLGSPVHLIRGGKPLVVHTFGFEALDGVDLTRIAGIRFAVNPDGPDYNGVLWMDDLRIGGEAIPAPEMSGVPDWSVTVGHAPFMIPLHDMRNYTGKMDDRLLIRAESNWPELLPDPEVTKEGLNLSPASGRIGTATVSLVLSEPGVPGNKKETFQLQVVPNLAPSLQVQEQLDLAEGETITLPLQAIDDGNPESRQALRLEAHSSNPALLPDPVLRHQGDDRWGELVLAPVPGATGEAIVTIAASDDGGTVAGGIDRDETSIRIRIFADLNHAPRMDPIRGIVWTEGAQEQNLVLTGLDDGDAERRQRLSIQVSGTQPDLLPEPIVSSVQNGKATLRFRPASGATGRTELTVTLTDDGGAPDNNGDATATYQIPVEIRPRPVTGFRDDFADGVTDPVWLNSGEGAHQSVEENGALRIGVDKFATNNSWAGLWFSLPTEMDLSANPRIRLRMKTDKPSEMLVFLWDAKDVYNTAKTVRHVVGKDYVDYDFDFTDLLMSDKGDKVDLTRIKALLINFAPGMLYKGIWWFEEIAVGDQAPKSMASGAGKNTEQTGAGKYEVSGDGTANIQTAKPMPLSGISAKGAYSAQITIDTGTKYQEMDGFGAFLGSGMVPGATQELLLPKVIDIGMSMARFGVIDVEFEPVNDNADPNVTDYDAFNLKALPLDWMRTLKASSGIGKFVVTMWSPPAWMKANRTLNSFYEAYNNKLEPRNYEEYAEHLVALVKTIKEQTGIDLYAISLQNEPQFNEPYASCVINPEEYRDLLRVVGPHFRAEGLRTQFYLPEALPQQKTIDEYIRTIAADPVASEFMDLIAIHNYDADGIKVGGPGAAEWADMYGWAQEKRATKAQPAQTGPTKTWMTETSGHADDWAGAETLAGNIYNAIHSGNASAWIFWSFNTTPESAAYGLLKNGEETARYAVSKQFYRTVRPGMVRVEAASNQEDLLALSFLQNVDGKSAVGTLILINRSDRVCIASLEAASNGFRLPKKWKAMVTTEKRFAVDGGYVQTGSVTLPPHSVVSLEAQE